MGYNSGKARIYFNHKEKFPEIEVVSEPEPPEPGYIIKGADGITYKVGGHIFEDEEDGVVDNKGYKRNVKIFSSKKQKEKEDIGFEMKIETYTKVK